MKGNTPRHQNDPRKIKQVQSPITLLSSASALMLRWGHCSEGIHGSWLMAQQSTDHHQESSMAQYILIWHHTSHAVFSTCNRRSSVTAFHGVCTTKDVLHIVLRSKHRSTKDQQKGMILHIGPLRKLGRLFFSIPWLGEKLHHTPNDSETDLARGELGRCHVMVDWSLLV